MFEKVHNIHFIGIGGMGVSALAKLACDSGVHVSGSDLNRNIITEALESCGAIISYGGHSEKNISKCIDVVVFSRAIAQDNPERIAVKARGIPYFSYPEYIARITKNKKVIGISGTHGKTTTTGLVGKMLINAGLDPTVIVGSYVSDFNGNARLGNSEYVVLEADEYRNAFEHYQPYISVVTTIDFDHPDYFRDIEDVKKQFHAFLSRTAKKGMIVASSLDPNSMEVMSYIEHPNKVLYGKRGVDIFYDNLTLANESVCDMHGITTHLEKVVIAIPGEHNVQNSIAVFAIGEFLGIEEVVMRKTFKEYHGPWRRFELVGEKNGVIVIDDYAHHPKEIQVTIKAARDRYQNQRVIVLFQPHHQERTRALFDDFSKELACADEVIITDMYRVPGRKTDTELDLSKMVSDIEAFGTRAYYVHKLADVSKKVREIVKKNDILLVMGAGNINTITQDILTAL